MDKEGERFTAKINELEEHLAKYKKTLHDTVVAYRQLKLEKEAVEQNLKSVSSVIRPSSENNSTDGNVRKENINHLVRSVKDLTDEKSKLESVFQTERKELLQKNKALEERVKILKNKLNKIEEDRDMAVENAKSEIILSNHKRESEHLETIKKLTKNLTDEKKYREEKEGVVEKLKCDLKNALEEVKCYKISEQHLKNELAEAKKRAEKNSPSVSIEKLKTEMKFLKERHDSIIQKEQKRALKAEERARKLGVEHENRVCKLEQQLSQLSTMASNYDKHRREDQLTISALKERLVQLELESDRNKCEDDQTFDVENAKRQVSHLKRQLLSYFACNPDEMAKIKEFLSEGLVDGNDEKCDYKERYFELQKLHEECKENSRKKLNEEGLGTLRDTIARLREKMKELQFHNERISRQHVTDLEKQREVRLAFEKEKRILKKKMADLETDCRDKLIAVEKRLEKRRERVAGEMLQEGAKTGDGSNRRHSSSTYSDQRAAAAVSKSPAFTSNDHHETEKSSGNKPPWIFYAESVARRDVEIDRLMKCNKNLEGKVHDLQHELYALVETSGYMKEQIRRFEKYPEDDDSGRTNSRYLKNVFLNYLTTLDAGKRTHMLNAIFAILQFSDVEISNVLKFGMKIYN